MKTGYKVADAMTKKPVSVSSNDDIKSIAQLMAKEHVSSLVVVDKKKLVGIITEQDIVRNIIAKGIDPYKKKVGDVMVKEVVTIKPEMDIYDAIIFMRDRNFRHLPVMDGKNMVGFLTIKDILKIEPQLFEIMVEKFELREEEEKPVREILKRPITRDAEISDDHED